MKSRLQLIPGMLGAVGLSIAWGLYLLHGTVGQDVPAVCILLVCIFALDFFAGTLAGLLGVLLPFITGVYAHIYALRTSRSGSPLLASGNIGAVLIIALGLLWVLERWRHDQRVGDARARELTLLLESMGECVFVFDGIGRLVALNPAALTLLGRPESELLGRTVEALASDVRADEPATPTLVRQALEGRTQTAVERSIFDPVNTRRVHFLCSVAPIRTDGEISGALLVLRDVSELRALNARILESERHVATGQMAASVTHDFNNILEVIEKAATILDMADDQPAADRKRYTEMIHMAARRGAETIRRLREYLAGGGEEMRQVDVNELVRDSIELTRPLWRDRTDLHVSSDFNPVPPVRGNPVDLRRVLTNLILNAIQAMGETGGTVRIHTELDPPLVRCSVEDTGPGIPQQQQKNIFTPYYTTKISGTGLGLSGAQKIILAHGGNLTFYSEEGRGTRFNIELPMASADSDSESAGASHEHVSPSSSR